MEIKSVSFIRKSFILLIFVLLTMNQVFIELPSLQVTAMSTPPITAGGSEIAQKAGEEAAKVAEKAASAVMSDFDLLFRRGLFTKLEKKLKRLYMGYRMGDNEYVNGDQHAESKIKTLKNRLLDVFKEERDKMMKEAEEWKKADRARIRKEKRE